MFIKRIVVEGVEGEVQITRTGAGALVTCGGRVVCQVLRDGDREARYERAVEAARAICGTDRRGRPCATNSMVHEVLDAIDRVAGC